MMKKSITYFLMILLIIIVPLLVLLLNFQFVVFDTNYFTMQLESNNVMENTKMEKEELITVMDEVFDYLKGDRDNFNIYGVVGSKYQEVFNEREKLHMTDVQILFIKGFFIRNILFLVVLLSSIYLFIVDKRKLLISFIFGALFFTILIGLSSIIIYQDFNKYFTIFHKIFFSNDLWLLNPNTDILINIVPLNYFIDVAKNILIKTIVVLDFILVIGIIGLRYTRAKFIRGD